jgi:hypothetical protein
MRHEAHAYRLLPIKMMYSSNTIHTKGVNCVIRST